jgi:hypothetical protein
MESNKLMNNIQKVAGTSSGAIMALPFRWAIREEIENLIGQTNLKNLMMGDVYLWVALAG